MTAKLLISVFGDDRPGIVQRLSQVVRDQDGNWLESHLSHLGGRFAGLILAEFPATKLDTAFAELNQLSELTLDIRAEILADAPRDYHKFDIEIVGNDKAGIVNEITNALSRVMVNVESLNSTIEPAPMSGGELFKAAIVAAAPLDLDIAEIQTALEAIAADLMVEINMRSTQ
ncbi:MAG: glycine cleavage system protein R [Gammaproteobacteria bacterium]|nr:glycine cleavage system protein R [Gammaproteobacteria bacterium]